MSREIRSDSIPSPVRKSEVWAHLAEVLAEFDVKAHVGRSKRHWFLEIEVGHTPRKHFFSTELREARGLANNVASLRRVILTGRTNPTRPQ